MTRQIMKWSLLLFSSVLFLQAHAQYPATGNKMRLGWQTTGDGLVYRGAIGDTTTLDPSGINNAWMLLDTASGNLYAYRTKAWRLVSGGGGGGLTMPFDSVTFNINETDASLRELKYSEEKGYLQYGGQDSVQIPLLPGIWYVRNDTSVTIPKGTVLRATGTLGASGRIKVKHMIADGSIDAMYILGIAMQDIAVGADGYAMSHGKIRQVNTQAYSEGAVLYADVDTLGGLTQTEPGNGFLKLPIAFVVHSASNGTLAVRITSGAYMRDLHDAEITSPVSNASLYYNAAQGIWRDTTGAVLTSDTSVFARDFQISGTANRLAMFTGSNTVGNSVVDVTSDTVSIRDYSNSYTTWRFHSNINKRGFIGYPSGTRFYSLVNPALYAGFMYGDRSAGAQDQQAFTQLTAWNGGGAASGFFSAATTLNGVDITLYFNISGLSANANPTFPAAQMVIQKGGNVGINTTTPTAKLHINNPSSTTPALNIVSNSNVIGSTNDAVSINMQPGQVNQNNTGVRVFNTITGTSAEGNNTGIAVSLNARNSSYGVYSAVSKNWGSSLFGEAIGVYGSATTDSPFGFSYGGYFKNDTTQGTGFGVFVQTTTPKGSGTVTPLAVQHNSTELMRVQSSGNVGIATSSPSRPLHVNANSSMIIPSGATGTRPASGASGDLRYSTTFSNIEFYRTDRWMRPLVGTVANNKVAFALNDTITSNTNFHWDNTNTRLGIGNASPDSTLTVTGGIRTTTSIRTGSDATINGIRVGRGGGNLLSSVAIGDRALNGANSFGFNVAIGQEALLSQTSGYYNIAIGPLALKDNTDQSNLVAIGLQALEKNSTGYYNVAVGSNVLGKNTSGNNNAGFGYQALFENISGAYNIALGALPLYSNTTGSYNIAIGSEALKSNVSATYNAAIGTQALFANTTGGNNFALGAFAFRNNINGANNVIIGNEAGRHNNSGDGVTKLDNSILIGYDARPSATSGNTGEVVIGYQARGNGSNTTTIGNSSTTATILPAGNLGIAITNTTARLHLPAGTASANTAPLKFTSGTNLTTAEAGAVEWNGTNVFVTNSSATRQTVNQGLTGSATMDFPNTDAQKSSDLTITVTGASDGDVVSLGVPNAAVNANTCYTAWISSANTVTVRFNNYSSIAVNPASATFKVFVTKF